MTDSRTGGIDLSDVLLEVEKAAPVDALAAVTRRVGAHLGASWVSFLVADMSGRALVRLSHDPGDAGHEGRQQDRDVAMVLPFDGGPQEQVLRTQSVLVEESGGVFVVRAPVTQRGETIGLLEIALPAAPPEAAVQAVSRAAHTLAFVIVANRRYTDLFEWGQRTTPFTLAAEIQRRLLPASFTCEADSFTLAAWLEPAASIGGDTFDYSLARDLLHLSITDAVGHGVQSALTATLCVGSLRNTRRRGGTLLEQAQAANDALLPLNSLTSWITDPRTGNIAHQSGKFFAVEGLDVTIAGAAVPHWQQPIINQAEVGVLGLVVKKFDGVLHCLVQAKAEPGNGNGIQLSPTVQATRSNYTRVHQGTPVPYLEHFRDGHHHRVLADIRQSEQGSWFLQKRNRNMIVEVTGDIETRDGYCWLTIGQVHELLAVDDLINMDMRSVLSCLPFAGAGMNRIFPPPADDFAAALIRSYSLEQTALHRMTELLSWITEMRTEVQVCSRRIPLAEVADWQRDDMRIAHRSGRFFTVIGVTVTASGREVRAWNQPMIEPCDEGIAAFLVKRVDGVLHLLVHARVEAGYVDVVELAPTVQCTPSNYDVLPQDAAPIFLGAVLNASPDQIRFDAVHSEEGGRFFQARNRNMIVEVDERFEVDHPSYRWFTLGQLASLLQHSNYVNIQARSLIACLHSRSAQDQQP